MQLLAILSTLALLAPSLSAPADLATPVELDPRLSQVNYNLSYPLLKHSMLHLQPPVSVLQQCSSIWLF